MGGVTKAKLSLNDLAKFQSQLCLSDRFAVLMDALYCKEERKKRKAGEIKRKKIKIQ